MKEVVGEDAMATRGWFLRPCFLGNLMTRIYILAKDWVVEQTLERVRRELEADEQEYETRLAQARKREEIMRRAAKGRVTKRLVSTPFQFLDVILD